MLTLNNDEPTLLDLLDRTGLVRTVGDAIAHCTPPHVFGIHGDWGAGKTSFLHQLHYYLAGDCPQQPEAMRQAMEARHAASADASLENGKHAEHVTAIWFEAWRYQHEAVPIVALLQEIRAQLPLYSKALKEARKLGEVTIRSALLAFEDITKKIGIQASKIEAAGKQWEKENLAEKLPSHMIREHLEEALKKLLGKKENESAPSPRLVVLVDDLDRCEPEAAYRLLEGMKIYLNLPSCVFVLGMNQAIIESAIAKHQARSVSGETRSTRAREYLEKLCQDIWHLPLAKDPAGLVRQWLPETLVRLTLCQIIKKHPCVPANARKIKAFANVLQRFQVHLQYDKPLEPEEANRRSAGLLVLFAYLYHFHRALYRQIEGDSRFYEELRRWASGQQSTHPAFKDLERPDAPIVTDKSETAPTPEPELEPAYPDPARGNVLRVQSLIIELGAVSVSEIEACLLR